MLYRYVIVNEYNLNNYYMAQKNIICFPYFSSTSFKIGFKTTNNALKINNIGEDDIVLLMKLKYYYFNNNVPPCIVLKKLSTQEHEEEVLLFPFTFIYVESLKKIKDK